MENYFGKPILLPSNGIEYENVIYMKPIPASFLLLLNDKFFAYIKGAGYIGYGIVQEEAVPVNEFLHEGHLFIDDLPDDHIWKHVTVDNMSGEWLVRVKWYKTFPQEQVKWLSNGFANQNVVCKLRDARTFEYLKKEFEVDSLG